MLYFFFIYLGIWVSKQGGNAALNSCKDSQINKAGRDLQFHLDLVILSWRNKVKMGFDQEGIQG